MSWREAIRSSLQKHNTRVKEHLIIFYKGEGLPYKMKIPEEGTRLHTMLMDSGVLGAFLTLVADPVKEPKALTSHVIVTPIIEKLSRLVVPSITQTITGGLVTAGDGLMYNANCTLWVVTKKQKIPVELKKEMRRVTIPSDAEIWWLPSKEELEEMKKKEKK